MHILVTSTNLSVPCRLNRQHGCLLILRNCSVALLPTPFHTNSQLSDQPQVVTLSPCQHHIYITCVPGVGNEVGVGLAFLSPHFKCSTITLFSSGFLLGSTIDIPVMCAHIFILCVPITCSQPSLVLHYILTLFSAIHHLCAKQKLWY